MSAQAGRGPVRSGEGLVVNGESNGRRRRRGLVIACGAVVAAMLGVAVPSWAEVSDHDCVGAADASGWDCIVKGTATRTWDSGGYLGTLTFSDTVRYDLDTGFRPIAMTVSGSSLGDGWMTEDDDKPTVKLIDTWTMEQSAGNWSFSVGGISAGASDQDGRSVTITNDGDWTVSHEYRLDIQPSSAGATATAVRHSVRAQYTYPDGTSVSQEVYEVLPLSFAS